MHLFLRENPEAYLLQNHPTSQSENEDFGAPPLGSWMELLREGPCSVQH